MTEGSHTTVRIDSETNDIIEAVQDNEEDEYGKPSKKAIVKHALQTVYGVENGGDTAKDDTSDH